MTEKVKENNLISALQLLWFSTLPLTVRKKNSIQTGQSL